MIALLGYLALIGGLAINGALPSVARWGAAVAGGCHLLLWVVFLLLHRRFGRNDYDEAVARLRFLLEAYRRSFGATDHLEPDRRKDLERLTQLAEAATGDVVALLQLGYDGITAVVRDFQKSPDQRKLEEEIRATLAFLAERESHYRSLAMLTAAISGAALLFSM